MSEDLLGYNEMVEQAMRSVVRKALDQAARGGLPGEHHFYITFRTDHPDVVIPKRLSSQHPEEMTIILQHQFWGLQADEEGFDVELSFNRRNEHLRIPYSALVTFADPSVNFGLQFHIEVEEEEMLLDHPEPASDEKGLIMSEIEALPEQESAPVEKDEQGETAGENAASDNVVTLDFTRKK